MHIIILCEDEKCHSIPVKAKICKFYFSSIMLLGYTEKLSALFWGKATMSSKGICRIAFHSC